MNREYDVIVVGAGPGGSTTARFCAQAGLRTLLIEKDRLPRDKPCGGCLSLKSVRLIEFDLTPVIENTIFGVKFTYRLKDPVLIRSNNPIGYMVMRERFDQFLVERALEEGTALIEGEKVIKVAEKDEGVEVQLARGRRFLCDYVVGADGPESLVARSFAPSPPRGIGWGIAVESKIPFESVMDFPKEQQALIHLDFGGVPNGYGWVFPKREGLSIGIGGMFQ
ncbi:MAG: geranylgeranyl reductase family protein, partial [Deltaproteobacteria bacterium]